MNVNQRVEHLISKVASSKSAFSKTTGISAVIISHICSGRNKVSLAAISQILKAYPSVSTDWLVLGKGSIYVDTNTGNEDVKIALIELQNCHDKFTKDVNAQLKTIRSKLGD